MKSIAPEADPMVYVLLFPYGESGWHVNMQHVEERSTEVRKKTTMLQFYSYRSSWRAELQNDRVFYASKLTHNTLSTLMLKQKNSVSVT